MKLILKDVRLTPTNLLLEAVDDEVVVAFVAIANKESYVNIGVNVEQLRALREFCDRRLSKFGSLITWET